MEQLHRHCRTRSRRCNRLERPAAEPVANESKNNKTTRLIN